MDNDENEFETKHEVHNSENAQVTPATAVKPNSKNSRVIKLGILILVILIIGGGLGWLYTGTLSAAKQKVFKVLPLPAAIVDMKFVTAKDALGRIDLAKQLAESQGLTATAPSDTFDQMLDAKKLAAVAGNHKVSVTQAEIDEEYNNIVKQYAQGNEDQFKTELDTTYHMTPDKFKNDVIKQELVQSDLSLWYSQQQDLNKDAYATAKGLQDKLTGGQSFDDVSKAYNQDQATQDFAGDSGIIAFDDLLPEFRTELKDAKVGDTKLVASRYGLHILKLLEDNNDGANGARQVHLQQIFIKQAGFADWLKQQTDNIRVIKLLKFS